MKNTTHSHGLPHAVAAQIAALRKEWHRAFASAAANVAPERRPATGWRVAEVRAVLPR